VVFTSDDFAKGTDPFNFDSAGEEVYIFSADAAGNLTGYVHGFTYGREFPGRSFGRYIDSAGRELFVTQESTSLGQENTGPWQAPVIVSEINYHPPDVMVNGTLWSNFEDEFVEIVNRSAQPVALYDSVNPESTWKMDGGLQFTFPTNTELAPNAFALLVNFDPVRETTQSAAFRTKFNVSQNVPLFGPFKGNLGNDGDRVSVQMPDAPPANGTVPYLVEDEIEYSDGAPWNAGADGFGFSLVRKDLAGFGNDPGKWTASAPRCAAPPG